MLKKINFVFCIVPILIFAMSALTMYSVGNTLLKQHILVFCIGYILFFAISLVDIEVLRYYWQYLYIFIVATLGVTHILGTIKLGAARWINLGLFTVQPSEFAKAVTILSLASFLSFSKEGISNYKTFLKFILLVIFIAAFVIFQPDLGTALIVLFASLGIGVIAGVNRNYILFFVLSLGILSYPVWTSLYTYQQQRILVFIDPTIDSLGAGYNVLQSIIAVGSGGVFGKGLGNGTQAMLNYLPIYWTDFMFAAFAEEWGLIGIIVFLALYVILLLSILFVAYKVDTTFALMISIGVFCVFFAQFVINVGMNLGVMPVTGIPLPFMSYGGSSMVVSFILLGMLHSVWIYQTKN